MKVGDLVKLARPHCGVPFGTIGLITKVETPEDNQFKLIYYSVQLCNVDKETTRRYLRQDLRPI